MNSVIEMELINPDVSNERNKLLCFEKNQNESNRFKNNIKRGSANLVKCTVTKDFIRLGTNFEWTYYHVHKMIEPSPKFLLIEYTNFEYDEPAAKMLSETELVEFLETKRCGMDIKRIKRLN